MNVKCFASGLFVSLIVEIIKVSLCLWRSGYGIQAQYNTGKSAGSFGTEIARIHLGYFLELVSGGGIAE